MTLADLTSLINHTFDANAITPLLGGAPRYQLSDGGTASADVTSIDPFIATLTFDGLNHSGAVAQSLTTGVRCDLPGNELTIAATPPQATPTPTAAPGGTLIVTVGDGAGAISKSVSGPAVTCSLGAIEPGAWFLSYSEENVLDVELEIPAAGHANFTLNDWTTQIPTLISIDPPRTGGHIDGTVDDRGSEVDFTAQGATTDGQAVSLTATCAAITRI